MTYTGDCSLFLEEMEHEVLYANGTQFEVIGSHEVKGIFKIGIDTTPHEYPIKVVDVKMVE